MEAAADLFGEPPNLRDRRERGTREAVGARDVEHEEFAAGAAARDAGTAPDEGLGLRPSGHGHKDPLAGGPRRVDVVRLAIPVEALVDAVGQPEERELAQGGEIAGAEIVRQRGVDLLGLVDVAVREPAAQRLGGHVDEFDLVGGPHDGIGHGLLLDDPGDVLDGVVE